MIKDFLCIMYMEWMQENSLMTKKEKENSLPCYYIFTKTDLLQN